MKKQVKIISVLLIVLMALTMVSTSVFATVSIDQTIKDMAKGSGKQPAEVVNLGKTIVTIMQTVGIVVAVVVLLVIGIKYMIGSAEEKAEYKKTMIPYVIGAILLFASTTIVGVVYNLANSFNP